VAGRPSQGLKRTTLWLLPEFVERILRTGKFAGNVSAYARHAIEKELQRDEKKTKKSKR